VQHLTRLERGTPLITRREFVVSAGALVATAALFSSALPAFAQSQEELMRPGPLPDLVLGKADAPVTIIEYASMTCPHCANFHKTTYPALKEKYIDTGKVRFIFREFPLDQLAVAGSALARCAGKDKYFPLVETLFQQQRQWVTQKPLEPLQAITRQAGMTQQTFDACLQDQKIIKGIEQTREIAAQKFGVNSTPTLFINGKKYSGAMAIEDIEREITPYLKS
jgi:protein-disulfide isomerase